MTSLTRRSMLRGLGLGGLALGFYPSLGVAATKKADKTASGFTPNVFLHLKSDGSLLVTCHRSEMGQGIRSTIPVIFADELGADMSRVTVLQADGDKKYGDQNTDGSSSIRGHLDWLRRTGATARTLLITVAAKRWRVKPEDCEARDHAVFNKKNGAKFDFGALADEAGQLPVPEANKVMLRPDLKLFGKNLPLLDGPAYVNGTAKFGADVTLPGMLIAVIARPPVVGGSLKKFDATRALAVPGVKKVVEVKSPHWPYAFQQWGGVAVLADNTWAAMRGRAALDVEWDDGGNASYDSAEYRKELSKSVNEAGSTIRDVGDVDAALKAAAKVIEAEYHVPHLPHVPMEPPVALADFRDGRCEVWASTQNPQAARKQVASSVGLSEDDVAVHVTLLGGGFGRKSKADFCAEAALLSKEVGAPVRVQWTREDDLRHDYFNTVSTQKLTAGLDASGKVTAWRHRTAFPPIASLYAPISTPGAGDLQQGVLDLALSIPNVRAEACSAKAHVRIGWLRSVYNIFHGFAGGSFIDELAHATGKDPKAMWLEVLGPARHASLDELGIKDLKNYGAKLEEHPVDVGRLRNVIERVTKLAKWDERGSKRALGLAAHRSFLSYVATVVEVEQHDDGRVRVKNAWLSCDAGLVANFDRVRSQMEGAVVFGISLALFGGVTMKNGVAEQSNFHDMRLARMHEVPREIHVDLVESQEPAGGVGEPGVPPVAPAIANAIFALTGKRIRNLPIKNELSV